MRTITVLLLIGVVGAGAWFAASWYTRDSLEVEMEDIRTQIQQLTQEVADLKESEQIPELTIAGKRAAIVGYSTQLTSIYEPIMSAYDTSLAFGARVTYEIPLTIRDVRIQDKYTRTSVELVSLASQLQGWSSELEEMLLVKDALLDALNHNKQMLDSINFYSYVPGLPGTGLPGAVYFSSEEAYEKAMQPYRDNAASTRASYTQAAELWQSVLDEYGIADSEIGLTEPLIPDES